MDFAYVKQEKQNNQTCTCDQIGIDNYFKKFLALVSFHTLSSIANIFSLRLY